MVNARERKTKRNERCCHRKDFTKVRVTGKFVRKRKKGEGQIDVFQGAEID